MGLIKSAAGIGALLIDGIGDTLRVSLTADPVREVKAGISILRALSIRRDGVNIISCPTCGRTKIDLIKLSEDVSDALRHIKSGITVAVMGCAVNGPGEAGHADYGIAGGENGGVLFRRGKVLGKYPAGLLLDALTDAIAKDNIE
jgi:(E)-4-hydroxy-3-methylbut-2-enyl-diphosphate synthase